MDQIKKLFASLSPKQKISTGIAALFALVSVYAFTSWRHQQDFKPLFTGVAPAEASVIVQKIKESGIEYRLSDTGGVISVPSAKVAELRLDMAAVGLPKSGRIGFELFDKTNFGATEFVEHINYMRALEGELERSIGTLESVDQARVHLTQAQNSVFVDQREPAKASVVVSLKPGSALLPRNVVAIQQLVANAVEDLDPSDVSVVDTAGVLLSHRKLSPDEDASDAANSRRQTIEHDFLEKINSTLVPMLGRDKFRAGVTVDCDLTSAEQSEETFDPNKSVIVSSQKSEDVVGSGGGAAIAGIPGTATNLPRPAARPASGPSSTTSRRTENVTYQTSHVVRKTHLPDGGIKRISVSVLLDQNIRWSGAGKNRKATLVPPSAELQKAVHDVVAGLTGFVQERGDQILVSSVPFETTVLEATSGVAPHSMPSAPKPQNLRESLRNPSVYMSAAAGAAMALLIACAGLVWLKKKRKSAPVQLHQALGTGPAPDALNAAERENAQLAGQATLKLSGASTRKSELLRKEIRESAKKDIAVPANILQSWIQENA
jgi:flagellar M-ring protein FliF